MAFATLRPGNVHGAEDRPEVLESVIARYRERGFELYFRGDAGFAKPEIYQRHQSSLDRPTGWGSVALARWACFQTRVPIDY